MRPGKSLLQDEIKRICRFFSIGTPLGHEKENGTPHTHLYVFVSTTQGKYALKFYQPNELATITTEYIINRILVNHRYPTPEMSAGIRNKPFFPGHDRLITCYSYINGVPACQLLDKRNIFPKINTAMLSLKNILSATMGRHAFPKPKNLVTTINAMRRNSNIIAPYKSRKLITKSLLDASRSYRQHRHLFTCQWVHNNVSLTNLLIYKKTVYILDLEHVRQDFSLNDLACLVVSCLLVKRPPAIKPIVNDYFTLHEIGPEYFPVLNVLVKIRLVRRYLNDIEHEKAIPALLEKINHDTRFIV